MIYIDIIFSCFATYEFCLYAALIARKVEALRVHFCWLFVTGLTLYGLTRALQTALLISLFVFAYGPMSHASEDRALYWVGLVLSGGLLALQLWTFVIYRAIWQSTKAKLGFDGMHLPKTIKLSKKRPADKPQVLVP